MTGTLYEMDMEILPGADEDHEIPSGYWKIVVYQADPEESASIKSAAFIFPQDTPRKVNVLDYLVTIDEIESRSGLDVLWKLPDDVENLIESSLNTAWAKKHFQ